MENNICELLDFGSLRPTSVQAELEERCNNLVDSYSNYNVFVALSDLISYKQNLISSLQTVTTTAEAKSLTNSRIFMRFDDTVFFLTLNLENISAEIHNEILATFDEMLIFQWLFIVMLCVFMASAIIMETYILEGRRRRVTLQLTKVFLVLPPEIIAGNVYMVNFFNLRKTRFS